MKKSIVVSVSDTKFSALAFKENFSESIANIASLGFDTVELAIRNPDEINKKEIKKLLSKYDLPVCAVGTGQAYLADGLSFTNPDHSIRAKAVQLIKNHMTFADEIGHAQIIIGLIRGRVEDNTTFEIVEKYFIECMQECANYNRDIILAVEAINRYETNLYNNLMATKTVIDKIGRQNVKILIDTFHMNIEETDIIKSIMQVKDYISHVHIADSNRWAPGCGHINFIEILNALKGINYNGALSAEILPEPSPVESAMLTIKYFNDLGI